MEVLGDGQGNALYPARHELMGKTYGTDRLLMGNGGMTHGGWFSQGFGTIPEKYKPALLWSYNTFAAAEDQNRFDTLNYPHRAIMALVNWPIGLKAEYPFTDRRRRIHAGLAGRILDRSKAGTPHVPAEQRQRARHAGLPEHGRSRGGRRHHGPAPRRRGPRRRPRSPARPLAPTWSLPAVTKARTMDRTAFQPLCRERRPLRVEPDALRRTHCGQGPALNRADNGERRAGREQ